MLEIERGETGRDGNSNSCPSPSLDSVDITYHRLTKNTSRRTVTLQDEFSYNRTNPFDSR